MSQFSKKTNPLLVDNPIDLIAALLGGIAILVLVSLRTTFLHSTDYPSIADDALELMFVGVLGMGGMFITRLLLNTKKGRTTPFLANTFRSEHLMDFGFATASYFAIQALLMVLRNLKIFQVATVDVFAFYFAAAVCEELCYRGFLVMLVQGGLARMLHISKAETLLPINIFTCLISGSVFALVHQVYWTDPYLMLLTFLGGCSQAFWYLKTKNLTTCIVSHAVINLVASGSLVQSLGGSS